MKETLLKGSEPNAECECDAYGYDRYQPCGAACGRDIDLGKEDAWHFNGEHWHVACLSAGIRKTSRLPVNDSR